ncbi:hypothetical protein [Streptomyces sp. NBC_01092]|uniref:hypothetical protein n=1 Tax=Streptomyces sp. NBC_01092 TaxID=2903748 RepID=UPI00386DBC8D|nr:hypothetical protein OG254_45285 [Streptomyces sp. NBC_01092]
MTSSQEIATPTDEAVKAPSSVAGWWARHRSSILAVATIAVVALIARFAFLDHKSEDYADFYRRWYLFIENNGGYGALRHQFSNYNVPYLYLLATTVWLKIPPLVAVKLIPIAFDVLLGWYAYRITRLRYPTGRIPLAAALVVVLLPTVVLNSSMWGQCDSGYAALAIGGLYHLMRGRSWTACALFGAAFAFKLQAVFLFPVLLLMVLRGRLAWPCLLAVPGMYLLLDVPALLLGAAPGPLLSVYLDQASLLHGEFIATAPNAFQYLTTTSQGLQTLGVVLTGVSVLGLAGAAAVRRPDLTHLQLVLAAAVSALLVPFLLPNMHERYFYLADVLTVIAAFWLPRKLWFAPVLTQFASLFAYIPFLLLPYRLRDLTGNPDVVDGSGFAVPAPGPGWLASALRLGPSPREVLGKLFEPVISYQVLATAVLIALLGTIAVAAREFRVRQDAPHG